MGDTNMLKHAMFSPWKKICRPGFTKAFFHSIFRARKPNTRIECNIHENLSKQPLRMSCWVLWICGAASCICSVYTFSCLFSNEYKRRKCLCFIKSLPFCVYVVVSLCHRNHPQSSSPTRTRAISYEKIKLLKEASFLIRIYIFLIMKYGVSSV